MRNVRVFYLLLGIFAGLAAIGLSALFELTSLWGTSEETSNWLSSTLGNAGVTIALAAPVAVYLNNLSGSVKAVSREVDQFSKELEETQQEVRSLKEAADQSAETLQAQHDGLYEQAQDVDKMTTEQIILLVAQSHESGLISETGFRVSLDRWQYNVRFHCRSEGTIELDIEEDDGERLKHYLLDADSSLADTLAEIAEFVRRRGGGQMSPTYPVEKLTSDLSFLNDKRRFADPGDLDHIQQVVNAEWCITDLMLFHLGFPAYAISRGALNEDWPGHLREKKWFNDDSFWPAWNLVKALEMAKVGSPAAPTDRNGG